MQSSIGQIIYSIFPFQQAGKLDEIGTPLLGPELIAILGISPLTEVTCDILRRILLYVMELCY